MDFGKIDIEELDNMDFTLPKDHPQTLSILKKTPSKDFKIYVGCAKWGRKDWVGKLYPKGTKTENYLNEYAKQLNCIEYNASFYQLPSKKQIAEWKTKIGEDFLFCPKFQSNITHIKRLKNIDQDLYDFEDTFNELGNHLGPVFLMPPPQMGPKHLDTLLSFIDKTKQYHLFTEFRHPDWYINPHYDETFQELETLGSGSIITDVAGRRDCLHMRLTTPEVFIRFVGNSLHETDYMRIDSWVERIGEWKNMGLKTCYFFMHQHDELYSPELCKYLIDKLNTKLSLNLPSPKLFDQ